MTEAAVGFAGNLTDDPEVRQSEGGITGDVPSRGLRTARQQAAAGVAVPGLARETQVRPAPHEATTPA